jgi:hypothetical protein
LKASPLTKGRARLLLEQSRADIARLLNAKYETDREINRLLLANDELYLGILGEEAPDVEVHARIDVAS